MSFKIETIKKKADVFFTDDSKMSGKFFVSPVSPNHVGSEFISELLAGDRNFIPFESENGKVALIRKENIKMIHIEGGELRKDLSNSKKIEVQISFLSGKSVEGNVYYDLPESHSRLSDFFNSNNEFFYLESDEKDYLINPQFIKMVQQDTPE